MTHFVMESAKLDIEELSVMFDDLRKNHF